MLNMGSDALVVGVQLNHLLLVNFVSSYNSLEYNALPFYIPLITLLADNLDFFGT